MSDVSESSRSDARVVCRVELFTTQAAYTEVTVNAAASESLAAVYRGIKAETSVENDIRALAGSPEIAEVAGQCKGAGVLRVDMSSPQFASKSRAAVLAGALALAVGEPLTLDVVFPISAARGEEETSDVPEYAAELEATCECLNSTCFVGVGDMGAEDARKIIKQWQPSAMQKCAYMLSTVSQDEWAAFAANGYRNPHPHFRYTAAWINEQCAGVPENIVLPCRSNSSVVWVEIVAKDAGAAPSAEAQVEWSRVLGLGLGRVMSPGRQEAKRITVCDRVFRAPERGSSALADAIVGAARSTARSQIKVPYLFENIVRASADGSSDRLAGLPILGALQNVGAFNVTVSCISCLESEPVTQELQRIVDAGPRGFNTNMPGFRDAIGAPDGYPRPIVCQANGDSVECRTPAEAYALVASA